MSRRGVGDRSLQRRNFGARVRELRAAAGLTQEQLAEKADLHRTYIGQVERGERNISLDAMHSLAIGLGVHVARLFDDPGSGSA